MIKLIGNLIKWSFRLAIVLIVVRVFFADSSLYQNILKPILEPAFEAIFNRFPPLENHQENENDRKNMQKEEDNQTQNTNEDLENNKGRNKQKTKEKNEDIDPNCDVPDSKYNQSWKDLQSLHQYLAKIAVKNQNACKASTFRENLNIVYTGDDQQYYKNLYGQLVKFCSPKMAGIFKTFENIKKNKKLNQEEFAEMIVTFIQSIPYVLIIDKTAKEAKKDGGFAASYLNENKPYVENIKFGLQSPIEFLYNKKGDCDTRTVLAFTILKRFGYDVAILNCKSHSMLGLHLPAQGTSLSYQGKKYFFWETTAQNWQLGQIGDEHKNDKTWMFALMAKNN